MVEGKVILKSVTFEDLMKLNVLDKKEISLGEMNLNIDTPRTLEEEIEQKHKTQVEEYNKGNINPQTFQQINIKEDEDKEKKAEEKTIDDEADDLII